MPDQAPRSRRHARSLRGRLIVVWIISLATAVAAGTVLLQLYRQSSIDQVARADAIAARACDEIGDRYRFYVSGWSRPPTDLHDATLRRVLQVVAIIALARFPGVEGGVWQRDAGPRSLMRSPAMRALVPKRTCQGIVNFSLMSAVRRNLASLRSLPCTSNGCRVPPPVGEDCKNSFRNALS